MLSCSVNVDKDQSPVIGRDYSHIPRHGKQNEKNSLAGELNKLVCIKKQICHLVPTDQLFANCV